MEELFNFIERHWILSIIIILGLLAPGIVFVFLWNGSLFWTEDILKLLFLSCGIMCTMYVYNFILLYSSCLFKPVEKSIRRMGTERLLLPVIHSVIELGTTTYLRIFPPTGNIVTKEEGIQTIFLVSLILMCVNIIREKIVYKRNKEKIEKFIGRKFTDKEFKEFLKYCSDKIDRDDH